MSDGPETSKRERVLRMRAERLARVETADERRLLFAIAVVLIGEDRIGIPVGHLREIIRSPPITPLPGLPDGFAGVALVRGEILCALDLAFWTGVKGGGQRSCLVVMEIGGQAGLLGALADQSLGFRDVFEDDLAVDLGAGPGAGQACVSQRTRDLCSILDVPRLFADPRLIVGAAPRTGGAGDAGDQGPGRSERRS